ncbi:MAG: DUF2791 family P-loop domain-containing protein [Armatimonadetes bacterium]|nr:DUF2791 family P-loop domain-containing protein [Armatimonadota bacterium]
MALDMEARRTIEALRSGVPSRSAVSTLGTTQTQIESEFVERLGWIKAGKGARPIVVSANFGDGKSHLLRCLQARSAKSGFVTSFVVVSPETPLGNGHAVLKAIAEAAEAPGRTGKAVMELASNAPKDAVENLRFWARQARIHDRFRALLRVYEATRDEELRVKILGDIEGRPITKTQITAELKGLGEVSQYDLKSPRNALLAHDRLRLLAQFFNSHRASGLVVFFDEVERIERFTFRARLGAYEELGWWTRVCQESGSRLFAVFAETTSAVEQCLRDRGDLERIKSGRSLLPEERDQLAVEGAEFFQSNVSRLEQPTREQLESLQHVARDLYKRAYAVNPSILNQRTDVVTTVRSEIRRWITLWDLERHYPSYTPTIESEEITLDPSEIPDGDLAMDENDTNSE